jgi:hypothetical protein
VVTANILIDIDSRVIPQFGRYALVRITASYRGRVLSRYFVIRRNEDTDA